MLTPCKHPGCNALMVSPGYCERHASSAPKRGEDYQRWRKTNPNQSAIDSFRNSSAWQKTRRLKLSANPLCEDPFGLHRINSETARQVHHIQGLATHPELGMHWSNLMSVCWKCHARLENQPSE